MKKIDLEIKLIKNISILVTTKLKNCCLLHIQPVHISNILQNIFYHTNFMSNKQAELQSKINILQNQNSNLRDQIERSTQYFKTQLNRVKSQLINRYQTTISNLKTQLNTALDNLKIANFDLLSSRQSVVTSHKQMSKLKTQILDKLKGTPGAANWAKYEDLASAMKSIKIQALTSLPQFSSQYYALQGRQVRFIGQQNQNTHYIYNQPIFPTEQAIFKIKIIRTQTGGIGVGFVVYSKQKDARCSFNSNYAMCYYGDTKRTYPDDKQHPGKGFKNEDVVEVHLARNSNTVSYFVNGVSEAEHQNATIIGNTDWVLMPFVEMFGTGDTVEFLI